MEATTSTTSRSDAQTNTPSQQNGKTTKGESKNSFKTKERHFLVRLAGENIAILKTSEEADEDSSSSEENGGRKKAAKSESKKEDSEPIPFTLHDLIAHSIISTIAKKKHQRESRSSSLSSTDHDTESQASSSNSNATSTLSSHSGPLPESLVNHPSLIDTCTKCLQKIHEFDEAKKQIETIENEMKPYKKKAKKAEMMMKQIDELRVKHNEVAELRRKTRNETADALKKGETNKDKAEKLNKLEEKIKTNLKEMAKVKSDLEQLGHRALTFDITDSLLKDYKGEDEYREEKKKAIREQEQIEKEHLKLKKQDAELDSRISAIATSMNQEGVVNDPSILRLHLEVERLSKAIKSEQDTRNNMEFGLRLQQKAQNDRRERNAYKAQLEQEVTRLEQENSRLYGALLDNPI